MDRDPGEGVEDLVRARGASLSLLFQAVEDQLVPGRVELGAEPARGADRGGARARQAGEEELPEAEDVGPPVDPGAAQPLGVLLLGRHVGRRPDRALGQLTALNGVGEVRAPRRHRAYAEVGQLGSPLAVEEHVAGLHVAVHDPLLVRRAQRLEDRARDAQDLAQREPLRGRRQALGQAPAGEILHHEVGEDPLRPLGLADVLDPDDVRVLELDRQAGLVEEALRDIRLRNLQRDPPPDLPVLRLVDEGLAAAAEEAQDPEGPQDVALDEGALALSQPEHPARDLMGVRAQASAHLEPASGKERGDVGAANRLRRGLGHVLSSRPPVCSSALGWGK